jgi:cell division protein FtsB
VVSKEKSQLDRIEEMVAQLISIVAGQRTELQKYHAEMQDFKAEMQEFKKEMLEFKKEMLEFRSEVYRRLDRLEGQVVLLSQRMDYQRDRIAKVEEEVHLLKTR